MSETIVRKGQFTGVDRTGAFAVVSASGAVIAKGTREQLARRLEFYGEGARIVHRSEVGK